MTALQSDTLAPAPQFNADFAPDFRVEPFDPKSLAGKVHIAWYCGDASSETVLGFLHDDCVMTACCGRYFLNSAVDYGTVSTDAHGLYVCDRCAR